MPAKVAQRQIDGVVARELNGLTVVSSNELVLALQLGGLIGFDGVGQFAGIERVEGEPGQLAADGLGSGGSTLAG